MEVNHQETLNSFYQKVDRYKFIAHRLGFLMGGYPENSLDNLKTIFNNQKLLDVIDGIEFDVQFTADHVPIILHDLTTADICETAKMVKKTNYGELQGLKCGYRRSNYVSNTPWVKNNNYNLQTLENVLSFLMNYRSILANKIIKIHTKDILFRKEDFLAFKELLNKYQELNENIIHISFFPWNLNRLRKAEMNEGKILTKNELLIDFYFEKIITKIWGSSIDGISLGIKNESIQGNIDVTKQAKQIAFLNDFFEKRRNAVDEEWLRIIIKKYGYVGIYTINDNENIAELLSRVSKEFLDENADKLIITSDNPVYFKK